MFFSEDIMLREHEKAMRNLMIFIDAFFVGIAFFCAYFVLAPVVSLHCLINYLYLLPVIVLLWIVLLYCFGMYDSFRVKSFLHIVGIIFRAMLLGFILFSSFFYIFKLEDISRIFISTIFSLAAFFVSLEKIILLNILHFIRKKGLNFRRLLLVGISSRAQKFVDLVNEHSEWGFKIIGFVARDVSKVGEKIQGYEVLGSLDNILEVIHNQTVDEVIFVVPKAWLRKIERMIYLLEVEGIKVSLAIDFLELKLAKIKHSYLENIPLLTFETTSDKFGQLLIKRMIALVLAVLGVIVLSPVFLLVAFLIKFTSKGPIFFRQQRCGLNGRKFFLYKFRTMVVNAEEKLSELKQLNEMQGPVFKLTNDPRLTKVGKILRKFSLDELPQLWNVIKGDMDIVGPRPPLPKEVEQYDSWQRRRLSMRPGITCLWQVNGRNKIVDFNDWMRLDLSYIDNWSLWLDFKILCKTVPVVLFGIGAK